MRILKWIVLVVLGAAVLGAVGFLSFAPAIVEKGRNAVAPHAPYPVSDRAAALHDSLIIGDLHADPLLWKRDLTKRGKRGQVDIPRLLEGNVAVQVFTAVTKSPAGQNYEHNETDAFDNITLLAVGQMWPLRTWGSIYERAIYQAEKLHRFADRSDGRLRVIRTVEDLDAVLAAKSSGADVVGGLLGVEGAHPLEGDLAKLKRLEEAGYRLIALQHFFDNELGGTLHSNADNPLTPFGREVVQAVVDRGLILDLAHSSRQVVRDVLAMTDIPLVLSHTGIHSHCETQRNIPDDLMRQVAETGGVIGVGYWADVICDHSLDGIASAVVAAINVVGEDHVALGSDFDGSVETALDTSELAALTDALLRAGLSEAQITKVMGANMVRVLRERLAQRP